MVKWTNWDLTNGLPAPGACVQRPLSGTWGKRHLVHILHNRHKPLFLSYQPGLALCPVLIHQHLRWPQTDRERDKAPDKCIDNGELNMCWYRVKHHGVKKALCCPVGGCIWLPYTSSLMESSISLPDIIPATEWNQSLHYCLYARSH